jgi:hypothetical protein
VTYCVAQAHHWFFSVPQSPDAHPRSPFHRTGYRLLDWKWLLQKWYQSMLYHTIFNFPHSMRRWCTLNLFPYISLNTSLVGLQWALDYRVIYCIWSEGNFWWCHCHMREALLCKAWCVSCSWSRMGQASASRPSIRSTVRSSPSRPYSVHVYPLHPTSVLEVLASSR